MTKISELNSIPGNVGDSDLFPGVQGGSTYKVTASQLKSYISGGGSGSAQGTTKLTGNMAATAPFVLERDLVYGIPKAIEIVSGGAGYDNGDSGKVLLCYHSSLMYDQQTHSVTSQYNAKDYIARGLAVRAVISGGVVTTVNIVNPGQMYRVGDVLAVSHFISEFSGGGEGTPASSAATIRVTEVEPFILGNITNNHTHMGGGSPWVASAEYGNVGSLLSNAMTTRINPQHTVGPQGNDYIAMEQDWSAPVYVNHTQAASEGAPNYLNKGGGFSSALNAGKAGINLATMGWQGFKGVYDSTVRSSSGSEVSDSSHFSSGAEKYEFAPSQSKVSYEISFAFPGLWFLVTCWTGQSTSTQNASADAANFVNSQLIDNDPADADAHWPTTKYFIPQYQLGSIKVNGIPYLDCDSYYLKDPDTFDTSAIKRSLLANTPMKTTTSTIGGINGFADTLTKTVGGSPVAGFWDMSKTSGGDATRKTFANNLNHSAVVSPWASSKMAGSGQGYSYSYSSCVGFYLINALDILPDV